MTVSCYTLLIRYTYGKEHKQGGIMEIYSIKDEKFRRYGKVWSGFDCTRLIREMEHTPLPEDGAGEPRGSGRDAEQGETVWPGCCRAGQA